MDVNSCFVDKVSIMMSVLLGFSAILNRAIFKGTHSI